MNLLPNRPTLDGVFRPRSVAVVGASDQENSIGRKIMSNLVGYGFQGPVFPVNPRRRVVHSIKAYGRVSDIPERVDLAIIAVPKDFVLDVIEDCGAAGVRGLVVITAGFKETGGEGAALETALAELCSRHGMRMIGPNCMGVVNTDPEVKLLGSFASNRPIAGNAAFMSQSGALGEEILSHSRRIGVGISMFASLGNKADTSADDLLEYWRDDPRTELILMYLESFGSPRRFTGLAREISRTKPNIKVNAGRTARGARAAASHTGALAGADIATDAMMAQCGVLRAGSIEELFDMASVVASQPLPRGRRLAIVTNAGGPAILATDAAETLGLEMANIPDDLTAELAAALPATCALNNPIDLVADADAARYVRTFEILSRCDEIDMYLAIFVSPIMIDANDVARAIVALRHEVECPVVACVMGKLGEDEAVQILHMGGVPTFVFPESAVRGLAALAQQGDWVRRPRQALERPSDIDTARARRALASVAFGDSDRADVPAAIATEVLLAYGIPIVGVESVDRREAAIAAARRVGLPVALKIAPSKERFRHKSDIGGVRIDLETEAEVASNYDELAAISRAHGGEGEVLVQRMVARGKELILGLKTDPHFGPLLMVGAGGIYVEYTKDVAFRVAPIDNREAAECLQSLRTYPILEGVRGEPRSAIEVAIDALARLSWLAIDLPQITELDLNPFILAPDPSACAAVDVRMRIARPS